MCVKLCWHGLSKNEICARSSRDFFRYMFLNVCEVLNLIKVRIEVIKVVQGLQGVKSRGSNSHSFLDHTTRF
jgi:hypothetical protein